jgi:hypothetical protein
VNSGHRIKSGVTEMKLAVNIDVLRKIVQTLMSRRIVYKEVPHLSNALQLNTLLGIDIPAKAGI